MSTTNIFSITKAFLLTAILLATAGCSVPGTYMSSYQSVSSSTSLDGDSLKSTLIPLDTALLPAKMLANFDKPYVYKIGPYDVINVTVWNHPELSAQSYQNSNSALSTNVLTGGNSATNLLFSQTAAQSTGAFVDSNGEIILPLLGNVKVSGRTVAEVNALLTQKLSKYIRQPRVSVQVASFSSQRVHVMGEVMQPGLRPLTDRPLTILDAIGLSGGINTSTADTKHIYVIRSASHQNVAIYWLNAKSPSALLLAEHFYLANNDIIYVSPAGVVSWNRIMNQILPTLQTIWYTSSLIRYH